MTLLAAGRSVLSSAGVGTAAGGTDPVCYSRLVNDWVCPAYVVDRGAQLWDATLEHLAITVAAVTLSVLVAFPMALLARRVPRLESAVMGVSTGLYTVPSLAMFPLLVPFTGITATTVVLGLALYGLTILVRSMLAGLRAVPSDAVDAAIGMGYAPGRRLFRIELPLALPVIMAGLRVTTVSTVALTTVGTLLSYGGLGDLIAEGVSNNFRAQLLSAAVLCVVLAVVLDALIVLAQRLLTPWTRGVRV